MLKKIAFGGVYVTDPVVPTFSDPKLTASAGARAEGGRSREQQQQRRAGAAAAAETDDDEDRRRDPDHGLWLAA